MNLKDFNEKFGVFNPTGSEYKWSSSFDTAMMTPYGVYYFTFRFNGSELFSFFGRFEESNSFLLSKGQTHSTKYNIHFNKKACTREEFIQLVSSDLSRNNFDM